MLGYCIFSKSIHTSGSSASQFDWQVQCSLLLGVHQFLLCKKNCIKSVICLPTKHLGVLMHSRSNWNLEVMVLEERGKAEYPDKNLSEQRNESTTNLTYAWCRCWDLNRSTLVEGDCSHHCPTLVPQTVLACLKPFKLCYV